MQFRRILRAENPGIETPAEDGLGNPLEDDLANPVQAAVDHGRPRWCRLIPMRGSETVTDGGLEASFSHELEMRDSVFARGLTAADTAVIDGVSYQIRTPPMRSERPGKVSMRLEQGRAL